MVRRLLLSLSHIFSRDGAIHFEFLSNVRNMVYVFEFFRYVTYGLKWKLTSEKFLFEGVAYIGKFLFKGEAYIGKIPF
jgi:hypothetical protein